MGDNKLRENKAMTQNYEHSFLKELNIYSQRFGFNHSTHRGRSHWLGFIIL